MAAKRYSRLARTEEKKHFRSALFFGLATVILIALIVGLGFSNIARFASFISGFNKQETDTSRDITPPAPPLINPLPSSTNQQGINLEGTAEAGSIIVIYVNKSEKEILTDANSKFTTNISLKIGENSIYAIAVDKNGNQSSSSKTQTIIYDNEEPGIVILEPLDGLSYYSEKQKTLTVRGKTEKNSKVRINEKFAVVSEDGSFSLQLALSEGDNKITIFVIDAAGNSSEESLSVSFTR